MKGIDPEYAAFLKARAELVDGPLSGFDDLPRLRADYEFRSSCLPVSMPEAIQWRNLIAGGLPARLYERKDRKGGRPLVFFCHGGGWVMGGLESHHAICAWLADCCGSRVLALDYPLAPEHPYPAALNALWSALNWVSVAGAAELGADPANLFVAGDSSGGNLAAALALLARDRKVVCLRGQLLFYPALDDRCATPSYEQHRHNPVLSGEMMRWYWRQYLGGGTPPGESGPAPGRTADVEGFPATYIAAMELDPLRDEGRLFHEKLKRSGIPTVLHEGVGLPHACLRAVDHSAAVREIYRSAGSFVQAFASCGGGP
ncbi:MAG: alpha/beta hydrolase [Hyphomicrobiales bacterium]|nr:alpha/beta hydrolase [Hyphomicrobiales bacterium]